MTELSDRESSPSALAHTELDSKRLVRLRTDGLDEYPDGGFDGWMVVLADFICCFNAWGFTNSFGIFQTYYLANQLSGYSPSAVSWIGSFQTFLLFLPSCFVGRLVDAGYTFALFMTSISSEYYQFFLSQGVAFGLGLCALFLPAVAVVAHWFKRRRALALGIGAAGSSVGGVIYPITLNRLIAQIGFGWAVRVCAFLMFGTQLVAIYYLRPRLAPRPLRGQQFFDPGAFRDPIYVLVTVGLFLGFWGLYTPFFYAESFALFHDLSPTLAFYLLPILNAASTLGRIVPNFYADKIGCLNMMIPCVSLSGILILIWPSCSSEGGLIAFSTLYGFASGAFVSLPPAVVASISGPNNRRGKGGGPGVAANKIGVRVGQCFTLAAFATLSGTPISGALNGASDGASRYGSAAGYVHMSVFAGVVVLSGGLVLTLARLRWDPRVLVKV